MTKIIAYLYSDPLLETAPDREIWGLEVDRVYQDFGKRYELQQLLEDCQTAAPDYLLIRRLEELGDDLEEVSDRLTQLEALGIEILTTEQSYSSSQLQDTSPKDIQANLAQLLQQIQDNQRSRKLRVKDTPATASKPYHPQGKPPTDTVEEKIDTSSIAVLPQ